MAFSWNLTGFRKVSLRSWVIRLAPSVIFIAAFLLVVHYAKEQSANRDDAKLDVLRALADKTPVFSGFSEVDRRETSRAIDAGVYRMYHSSAAYEEVKSFYVASLVPHGWSIAKERTLDSVFSDNYGHELTFQKADLRIVIEHSGMDRSSGKWNYAVNFVWRSVGSPSAEKFQPRSKCRRCSIRL
jgi:hypothetical protein